MPDSLNPISDEAREWPTDDASRVPLWVYSDRDNYRRELERIVAALLGPGSTARLRGQCTNFVIGLCVFHDLGKEALKRFGYPPPERAADVPKLARLISQFALNGIRGFASAE